MIGCNMFARNRRIIGKINLSKLLSTRIFTTSNSKYTANSCSRTKTHPIDDSAKAIRHLQFITRLPFEKGLQIQEQFAEAQLDIKELHAKIKRKLEKFNEEHANSIINETESKILDKILAMKPNPIVLTFEFNPTYTGGKRVKKTMTPERVAQFENFVPCVNSCDVPPTFVQVERGGQVTFHGPGQMVAYIILDLKTFDKFPARCFVSALEEAVIRTLNNTPIDDQKNTLNIEGNLQNETGVWTNDGKKIASLGVHVRRSITSHGVCINVNPDLSYMTNFEMCGLPDVLPTSIKEQRPDVNVLVQDVAVKFVNELANVLGVTIVERMQLDDMDLEK